MTLQFFCITQTRTVGACMPNIFSAQTIFHGQAVRQIDVKFVLSYMAAKKVYLFLWIRHSP